MDPFIPPGSVISSPPGLSSFGGDAGILKKDAGILVVPILFAGKGKHNPTKNTQLLWILYQNYILGGSSQLINMVIVSPQFPRLFPFQMAELHGL